MQQGTSPGTPPRLQRWRVADLEIDVARARVLRAGAELSLPPLSFDLLVALVELAPAVATVDLLLERVWPGLVVNPETVSQRVKLLRSALGDDPRQPRYVLVVRGRGYRLLPPVEAMSDPAANTAAGPESPVPPSLAAPPLRPPLRLARPRARTWLGTAMLVGVAAAALLVWRATERADRPATTDAPAIASTGARADGPGPAAIAGRSIAVMPFEADVDPDSQVLATGVAEAVLHQLGSLPELLVIARTSAVAVSREGLDAAATGRRLGVRYLLEGSVQRAGARTRVTAKLVDARSGTGIWSLQFDRPSADVFAIQDEIALNVVRALQLRLDDATAQRLGARGTRNYDAWLEYLQARDLLAAGRLVDLPPAVERLSRAVRLDPQFAKAHVELARAELLAAEFDQPQARRSAFAAAEARARNHLQQALTLDPANGRAWLQRAYLQSFSDADAAEADFRRGLALSPNDADGHEGYAALLYRDPRQATEALEQIDFARRLDPLEPRFDVTKAVFLLYARSDAAGAIALLRAVLERHPRYVPALSRLGEALWCCTRETVEGIRFLEQALAEDPGAEWTRRALIAAYVLLGEDATAEALAGRGTALVPQRRLALLVARRDWRAAGELARRGLDDDSLLEIDEDLAVFAIRQQARAGVDLPGAIALFEARLQLGWDPQGQPVYEAVAGLKPLPVGLADLLQLAGHRERAARLLAQVRAEMVRESVGMQRGAMWYGTSAALAAALAGDRAATLEGLRSAAATAQLAHVWRHQLEAEPAYDPLRGDPEFVRILAAERAHHAGQRAALRRARATGLVPPARR